MEKLIKFLMGMMGAYSARISDTSFLYDRNKIKIGNFSEIQEYVILRPGNGKIIIGEYTQLNPFSVIYGGDGVTIGNNVMIAPHCNIIAGVHDYRQLEKPMRFASCYSKGGIVIEDDVWVGAGCTILDGVVIGHGSVIGANSLVNKNVEPYSVMVGSPAKKISSRLKFKNK